MHYRSIKMCMQKFIVNETSACIELAMGKWYTFKGLLTEQFMHI